MKKSLVQLAFNPFLQGTVGIPETGVPGTRSATTYNNISSSFLYVLVKTDFNQPTGFTSFVPRWLPLIIKVKCHHVIVLREC